MFMFETKLKSSFPQDLIEHYAIVSYIVIISIISIINNDYACL